MPSRHSSTPTRPAGTLLVIQHLRPDAFLTADQRQRLGDLMARWLSPW
jgi:hypothetical protein